MRRSRATTWARLRVFFGMLLLVLFTSGRSRSTPRPEPIGRVVGSGGTSSRREWRWSLSRSSLQSSLAC